MTAEKQTELPFNRREINRLIDQAEFPCRRRGVIRAVLKEIVFFLANKPAGSSGPPLDRLATMLGWSKRTVQRSLREAETMGVVTTEPVTGRDGRKASRYIVNRAALAGYGTAAELSWDGCQPVTGGMSDCHVSGDKLTPDTCQFVTANKERPVRPILTSTDQGARAPADLANVIACWNRLKAAGLVAAGIDPDRPAEAVLRAWSRIQRHPELRGLFADLARIEDAVRGSPFVQGAGWFTLAKLLGAKNKAGERIIERLLEGGYRNGNDRTTNRRAGPNALDGYVYRNGTQCGDP